MVISTQGGKHNPHFTLHIGPEVAHRLHRHTKMFNQR
jgi:hypothetical protein